MKRTISQINEENELRKIKRKKIISSLFNKSYIRIDDDNLYIYSFKFNCYCYQTIIVVNLNKKTITKECYSNKKVLSDLEKYDFFDTNLEFNYICELLYDLKNNICKYVKSICEKNNFIDASNKIFTSYPKLYKYDENKLIINDNTKDLTLDEYKSYIETYNRNKIETWDNENKGKLQDIGKYVIGVNGYKQHNNTILYLPRLFGILGKNTHQRQYSIDDIKTVFFACCQDFVEPKPNNSYNDYQFIKILNNDEIQHLKNIFDSFVNVIMFNVGKIKNKLDY